ncbi:peptidoglycan DD-metalloendopeptidase family protein [Pseudomonas mohnii]
MIKHSDTYVSSYGHNPQAVGSGGAAGQGRTVNCRNGSTGTNRVKLHFEVRRQGKPVDPLQDSCRVVDRYPACSVT